VKHLEKPHHIFLLVHVIQNIKKEYLK